MRTNANVELDAGTKTFASGLLPDLIAALRRSRKGDLVAVISGDPSVGPELEAWCRFTHNSLVDMAVEEGRTRWVLRYGDAPEQVGEDRPVGSRLWLYTNFDCNLSCDYCCVRSSPTALRRALGIERVRRIAIEAAELGVSEIFVTGGEPFMLPDIGEILAACAAAAPDHGPHQRHAVGWKSTRNAALVAARARNLANQPRQSDAGAPRQPSWKGDMGTRMEGNRASPRRRIPGTTGGDSVD